MTEYADSGFLFHGGEFTGPIVMRYSEHYDKAPDSRCYVTNLGGSVLTATASQANAYLLTIVEALYDRGALDMATAERLAYLSGSVLSDRQTVACPSCGGSGQVGPVYDPETCGSCRGEGTVTDTPSMSRDEYDAFMVDTQNEEV